MSDQERDYAPPAAATMGSVERLTLGPGVSTTPDNQTDPQQGYRDLEPAGRQLNRAAALWYGH